MEGMYSKLHDKYTKLKSQKEAAIENINLDQEVKFMDYKSAADELIEHLRNENARLRSQVIGLRSEMTSIRSSRLDQHGEPKDNRNETNERVQDLGNKGSPHTVGKENTGNFSNLVIAKNTGTESDTIGISNSNSKRKQPRGNTPVNAEAIDLLRPNSTRKRSRHHQTAEEVATVQCAKGHAPESDSPGDEFRNITLIGTGSHIDQPACCRRTQDHSGIAGAAANCVFQDLIEHLLGMKLSAASQAAGICISALHLSSGYSFKLTLVEKASKGEVELVYDPISLGTFEMGAPEWMKEVIIFSMLMSPIFFDRVLRVIKLQ